MKKPLTILLLLAMAPVRAQETPVAPPAPPATTEPVAPVVAEGPAEAVTEFIDALKSLDLERANDMMLYPMSGVKLSNYLNHIEALKTDDPVRLQAGLDLLSSLTFELGVSKTPVPMASEGTTVQASLVLCVYQYVLKDPEKRIADRVRTDETQFVAFKNKAGEWKIRETFARTLLDLAFYLRLY